jgi:23S rRNA pseudouridine1911/1915/1917 synthase
MSMPLRVRHLLSSQKISLREFILSQLEISSEYFLELSNLGAVYLNQERCFTDPCLSPGDYVRIHLEPKRFPRINATPEDLIIAQEKDFIVVNKLQGYPCHPLVDNCREDLLSQLEGLLREKLYVTHRLDIGTGGLWLVARNQEFQKKFNLMLQEKKVSKSYFARVENAWNCQDHLFTHYMKPAARAPREIFAQAEIGFLKCQLEIEKIYQQRSEYSDLRIKLHTGRTHQIRAQMSFLGHPIVGDSMYGSKYNFRKGCDERWTLWSTDLRFEAEKKWQFELPQEILEKNLETLKI